MKHQGAAWFLIILAGVFLLAVALYYLAKPPARSGDLKPVLPAGVQVALEGTRITSSQDGRMAWTMTGKSLAFYRQRGAVEVEEPRAWVPLEEGGTVEVKGRSGRYFQATEDIELENEVSIFLDRSGKREWIMQGDTASFRHGENAFYLHGLQGTMYSDQDESARISGKSGRYDISGRTMRLTDNVFCKWSKGITIETDKLDYSLDEEVARTDSRVLIRGQGFRLQGQGLRADMEGRNVVIPKAVKLRLDQGMKGVR